MRNYLTPLLFTLFFVLSIPIIDVLHKSWVDEAFFTEVVNNIYKGNGFVTGFAEWRDATPKIYGPTFFYTNFLLAKIVGLNFSLLKIVSAFCFLTFAYLVFVNFNKIAIPQIAGIALFCAFFEPNYNFEAFNGRMETMAILFTGLFFMLVNKVLSETKFVSLNLILSVLVLILGTLVTPRILVWYVAFGIGFFAIYFDLLISNWKKLTVIVSIGMFFYISNFLLAFGGVDATISAFQKLINEYAVQVANTPLLYDKYILSITSIMLLSTIIIWIKKAQYYRFLTFVSLSTVLYSFLVAKIFTEIGVYYTLYIFQLIFVATFITSYLIYTFFQQGNKIWAFSFAAIFFLPMGYKTIFSFYTQSARVYNEIVSLNDLDKAESSLFDITNPVKKVVGPSSFYPMLLAENYVCNDIERFPEDRIRYILNEFEPDIIILDDELKTRQTLVYDSLFASSKYSKIEFIDLVYNKYKEVNKEKFGFWLDKNQLVILQRKK
jgi:hypothetical protein